MPGISLRGLLLFFAFVLVQVPLAQAAPSPVVLDDDVSLIPLFGRMEVLRDASRLLGIDEVVRPEHDAAFAPLDGPLATAEGPAAFWIRFCVELAPTTTQSWYLEVIVPGVEQLALFVPRGKDAFVVTRAGERMNLGIRQPEKGTVLFKPRLMPGSPQTVYLRFESDGTVAVDAHFWSGVRLEPPSTTDTLVLGMINGGILAIIIFALFQYRVSGESIYLRFALYVALIEAMYLALTGQAAHFLSPELESLADDAAGLTFCLSAGYGLIFTAKVLDFERHMPRIARIYEALGLLVVLSGLSVFMGGYHVVAPTVNLLVLLTLPLTTLIALVLALQGARGASYFLAAFLVYITTLVLLVLKALGISGPMTISSLAGQMAAVPHVMLMALGLLHRSASFEAIRLEAVRRNERELERRVTQRTVELAETNTTLAAEVAERRAAEERLKATEIQLRAILDAAPFPMVVASYPEGLIRFANPHACELLRVPAEVVVGRETRDFYANPDQRRHFLWTLRETGNVLGAELSIQCGDGEILWTLLSAVRLTYFGEDAVLICLNDISTRKKLEESLRIASVRSEEALEATFQAMREQRNFLSMISHEFRVPLAIIQGASQILDIYSGDRAEAREEVEKIGRAVVRMTDLIDICLADDRLDSDSMALRLVDFDLGQILQDLCDEKRPFTGGREIILHRDGPALMQADASLLRVAFSNLIENALKFSPPQTPVSVILGVDGDALMVRVSDLGPGIALEDQGRIFEKFFRSTRSDRIRGAGLGLFIVRRVIERHNGSIAVDSVPGKGATFVVWLPKRATSLPEKGLAET